MKSKRPGVATTPLRECSWLREMLELPEAPLPEWFIILDEPVPQDLYERNREDPPGG